MKETKLAFQSASAVRTIDILSSIDFRLSF
jgi:hypothetical protein